MGLVLVSWSIRLALLLFFISIALRIRGLEDPSRAWLHRWTWTLGFCLFLAHVITAFHFYHHWSHAAAVEDTRRQTAELLGFEFGEGVYFNYAFLMAWATDLYWTWRPATRRSSSITVLRVGMLLFMLFIVFNGTVVFKSGWLRGFGILGTAYILFAWGFSLLNRVRDRRGSVTVS